MSDTMLYLICAYCGFAPGVILGAWIYWTWGEETRKTKPRGDENANARSDFGEESSTLNSKPTGNKG